MIDREKVIAFLKTLNDKAYGYNFEGYTMGIKTQEFESLCEAAITLLNADQSYLLEQDKMIKKLKQEPRVIT